ncbi:zinc ribbon domain-containing protein [Acidianus sp. HS-5]|uniref:zinc ribbon domain-containing protein n=1 Tax=Acidianus sp. HS-5 TaxID=2886040 RepID=UPI001F40D5A8|nr:zinc ribbon domain-containing protein [Acidianus sp. HS-5]BDC17942.1 hypothetical protein HS5_08320 [Acidianus sp. HS-5]
MVKYCPKCGYPNADDAKFCLKCGSPLPSSSILQGGNTPQQQPSPQPPPQPPTYQYPYMPQQPPKKKIPLKAIIGGVVAVIVVLVVFLVVLPLISPHGITVLASTAKSEFGGSWTLQKNHSGIETEISACKYSISFSNGTTKTKYLTRLTFLFMQS